jgi:hypothetical protein
VRLRHSDREGGLWALYRHWRARVIEGPSKARTTILSDRQRGLRGPSKVKRAYDPDNFFGMNQNVRHA